MPTSCRRRSGWPRDHRPAGRRAGLARDAKRAIGSHRGRQLGTFAGLLALCLILWAATPHFLTVSNLLNVLEQTALNAIVAMGMTFVIISGGIDLSVGSVLAFAGIGLAPRARARRAGAGSRLPSRWRWARHAGC